MNRPIHNLAPTMRVLFVEPGGAILLQTETMPVVPTANSTVHVAGGRWRVTSKPPEWDGLDTDKPRVRVEIEKVEAIWPGDLHG